MSNIYYWEKLMFSKLRFSWKENLKKCSSFEGQKGTRYIWGNIYFGIIFFGCLLSTKLCLNFFFNLFCSGDKRFLSQFLRKWGWFNGHNEPFPNILNKNLNFKKWDSFADERAIITTTLTSSYHWKTLVPFSLREKRTENTSLTLTVNYHKILQKNKLCHSKQQ